MKSAAFIVLGLVAGGFTAGLPAQDTVVVRADNRPVWGDTPRLVEELRIGSLEGGDASFGSVVGLTVLEDGDIWVGDQQAAEIRRFAADGTFLGVVATKGEGPGELEGISGLKRLPDDRVVAWDAHGGRFSYFDPDGAFLEAASRYIGVLGGRAEVFQVDTAGRLYHQWLWPRPPDDPGPARGLWYHVGQDGTVLDSIPVPPSGRTLLGGRGYPFGRMGPFGAQTLSVFSPHGYLVEARNDRYALHRPLADGRVLRIERSWEPVGVKRQERAQHAALAEHVAALWDPAYGLGSDVPDEKPPFWAIRVDEEGRLWVARHAEGLYREESEGERAERERPNPFGSGSPPPPLEWWEPLILDVIEPNGRYLGTLRFPDNDVVVMAARGRVLWVVELGDFDEQYVVRYRIEPG